MSAISVAMSGMRAAAARLEVSAEALVGQDARMQAARAEAAPPHKPANTPIPKVYRAARASLNSLDAQSGRGGLAPAADPAAERVEQILAAAHYRASLRAFEAAQRVEDSAFDILT